ncbi:MAG: serine hydrolase domain-containing protein, partial [Phycisphaerae bacterium]
AFRQLKPLDEHLAWFAWQHDRSRGLTHYGVRHYPDAGLETRLVIMLHNQLTGQWEALLVDFERDPPYRLDGLRFVPVSQPSQFPAPKKLTDAETAKQIDEHAQKLADVDLFSGVVLFAKDGKPLLSKAYGYADRDSKTPSRLDTKFRIGSLNMIFTGVAVAQLVEREKLSFQDKLSRYIRDDWVPWDISRKVSVHQLLTHTSGLGDKPAYQTAEGTGSVRRTLAHYQRFLAAEKLVYEPGTSAVFSHAGYLLLGAIIEKVAGASYCDYVREQVFKPAGITNTTCNAGKDAAGSVAVAYARKWKDGAMKWTGMPHVSDVGGGPAGGGVSTAGDLLKFASALQGHKLLGRESTERVLSALSGVGKYGYGVTIRGRAGNRVAEHAAESTGIAAILSIYLDTGYTAIVLSNYTGGARLIADKFTELLELRAARGPA